MPNKFEALEQFIGSYFHQDWMVESRTDKAVAARFQTLETGDALRLLRADLDDAIELFADDPARADAYLTDVSCFYYYQHDNLTGLEWLRRLRSFLESK